MMNRYIEHDGRCAVPGCPYHAVRLESGACCRWHECSDPAQAGEVTAFMTSGPVTRLLRALHAAGQDWKGPAHCRQAAAELQAAAAGVIGLDPAAFEPVPGRAGSMVEYCGLAALEEHVARAFRPADCSHSAQEVRGIIDRFLSAHRMPGSDNAPRDYAIRMED